MHFFCLSLSMFNMTWTSEEYSVFSGKELSSNIVTVTKSATWNLLTEVDRKITRWKRIMRSATAWNNEIRSTLFLLVKFSPVSQKSLITGMIRCGRRIRIWSIRSSVPPVGAAVNSAPIHSPPKGSGLLRLSRAFSATVTGRFGMGTRWGWVRKEDGRY
jgi:hypothetical protein